MRDKDLVPKKVKDAIKRIIRREVGRFGLRDVRVSPGEDHDGDPVLMVNVDYDETEVPVDTKVVAGLTTKIQDELWRLGEERFAHLHHHFSEDQRVAG
ncbi:MAG: hypothetical protein ACREER_11075 [Alphaproteobacteria bacterium]